MIVSVIVIVIVWVIVIENDNEYDHDQDHENVLLQFLRHTPVHTPYNTAIATLTPVPAHRTGMSAK